MTDFPRPEQLPLFISPFTPWSLGHDFRAVTASAPAVTTWTASQAIYIPVTIPWPYPVNRVWWINGSTVASANCDFGIYTPSGTKIYSTGSIVQAGASAVQYVTPGTTFILAPGLYYFAWACDSTTSHAYGTAVTAPQGALTGCLSQVTAFALPATATFATYGAACIEVCGVTRKASGF